MKQLRIVTTNEFNKEFNMLQRKQLVDLIRMLFNDNPTSGISIKVNLKNRVQICYNGYNWEREEQYHYSLDMHTCYLPVCDITMRVVDAGECFEAKLTSKTSQKLSEQVI